MHLTIIQHGEAVSKDRDPERPLSERGREDIGVLAARLERMGVAADAVYHSGKLRARQTAEILSGAVAPGADAEEFDGIAAKDDPDILISALDRMQANGIRSVLLASHMPYVSKLVSTLLYRQASVPFASVPGTAIALEYGEYGWQMNWMLRPECL